MEDEREESYFKVNISEVRQVLSTLETYERMSKDAALNSLTKGSKEDKANSAIEAVKYNEKFMTIREILVIMKLPVKENQLSWPLNNFVKVEGKVPT